MLPVDVLNLVLQLLEEEGVVGLHLVRGYKVAPHAVVAALLDHLLQRLVLQPLHPCRGEYSDLYTPAHTY